MSVLTCLQLLFYLFIYLFKSISYCGFSITQGFARVLLDPRSCLHTLNRPHFKCPIWINCWCVAVKLTLISRHRGRKSSASSSDGEALMSCCWWCSAVWSLSCRLLWNCCRYTVVFTLSKPVYWKCLALFRNIGNHIFIVSSYLLVRVSSLSRFSDFPWVKRRPGCLL